MPEETIDLAEQEEVIPACHTFYPPVSYLPSGYAQYLIKQHYKNHYKADCEEFVVLYNMGCGYEKLIEMLSETSHRTKKICDDDDDEYSLPFFEVLSEYLVENNIVINFNDIKEPESSRSFLTATTTYSLKLYTILLHHPHTNIISLDYTSEILNLFADCISVSKLPTLKIATQKFQLQWLEKHNCMFDFDQDAKLTKSICWAVILGNFFTNTHFILETFPSILPYLKQFISDYEDYFLDARIKIYNLYVLNQIYSIKIPTKIINELVRFIGKILADQPTGSNIIKWYFAITGLDLVENYNKRVEFVEKHFDQCINHLEFISSLPKPDNITSSSQFPLSKLTYECFYNSIFQNDIPLTPSALEFCLKIYPDLGHNINKTLVGWGTLLGFMISRGNFDTARLLLQLGSQLDLKLQSVILTMKSIQAHRVAYYPPTQMYCPRSFLLPETSSLEEPEYLECPQAFNDYIGLTEEYVLRDQLFDGSGMIDFDDCGMIDFDDCGMIDFDEACDDTDRNNLYGGDNDHDQGNDGGGDDDHGKDDNQKGNRSGGCNNINNNNDNKSECSNGDYDYGENDYQTTLVCNNNNNSCNNNNSSLKRACSFIQECFNQSARSIFPPIPRRGEHPNPFYVKEMIINGANPLMPFLGRNHEYSSNREYSSDLNNQSDTKHFHAISFYSSYSSFFHGAKTDIGLEQLCEGLCELLLNNIEYGWMKTHVRNFGRKHSPVISQREENQ